MTTFGAGPGPRKRLGLDGVVPVHNVRPDLPLPAAITGLSWRWRASALAWTDVDLPRLGLRMAYAPDSGFPR